MRIFVTGASGWIGSAVVPDLIKAGHEVIGLARSDAAVAAVESAGATVQRGSLDDLDSLRAGAAASEGVIHLAFKHDFSDMATSVASDQKAIEVLGTTLEGTGAPLVIASGLLGIVPGRVSTEADRSDPSNPMGGRHANAELLLSFADRGVRPSVVRLPPTVHGDGDHGFLAVAVGIAREKGVSGYVADGGNRWPAVHVSDAASLFRLAAEHAPAGAVLHAAADEGVAWKQIAEVIGKHLGVPAESIAPERAAEQWGWLGGPISLDAPASDRVTRELLGWNPTGPSLIEDLEAGHYFG